MFLRTAKCSETPHFASRSLWAIVIGNVHEKINSTADSLSSHRHIKTTNTKVAKLRTDTLRYYQNNETRMYYKTYKDKGYLIGSGATESAHRNIVQQRLKLSGQRWSIKGAQHIVNLRAYQKSDRWNEVIYSIKNAA